MNEQGGPLEVEFDNLEGICKHILVHHHDQAVGTGRVRFMQGVSKLERICILEPYRKCDIGKIIVSKLEEIAVEQGAAQVKSHGQTHAEGFYHKLGYQTASEPFIEDGIPHVLMIKEIAN